MAIKKSKSVIKRQRQTKKLTAHNKAVKNRIKTLRKQVNASLAKGDIEAAKIAQKALMSAADKAVKTGVIHKNKASNIKSGTAVLLNKAGQQKKAAEPAK